MEHELYLYPREAVQGVIPIVHEHLDVLQDAGGEVLCLIDGQEEGLLLVHILAGRHKYGNYLCVPNHDVGCELSDFSDIFWNEERIGSLMRKVDAVTVATGLVHLPALAATRQKIFRQPAIGKTMQEGNR